MRTHGLIQPSAGIDVTAGLPTICAAFQATVARHPSSVAVRLPAEVAGSYPSMKLERKPIERKYAAAIESLYVPGPNRR